MSTSNLSLQSGFHPNRHINANMSERSATSKTIIWPAAYKSWWCLNASLSQQKGFPIATPASKTKSRLLALAPELRNKIYHYALVSKKKIQANHGAAKSSTQPGLLETCRQIRKEAIELFHTENDFKWVVGAYYHVPMIPFRKVLRKYRAEPKRLELEIDVCMCGTAGRIHNTNLEAWVEAYWKDAELVAPLSQDEEAENTRGMTLARRAFGIADAMRGKPWLSVYPVLAALYDAINLLEEEDVAAEMAAEDEWESDEDSDGDDDDGSEGDSESEPEHSDVEEGGAKIDVPNGD